MNPEDDIESDKYKMVENQIIYELSIVKLLDTISNAPLLVQNQIRRPMDIETKLIEPYFLINPDFKDEWPDIKNDISSIFNNVNKVIEEKGFQNFFGKKNIMGNILIMLAIFIPLFILMIFFPDLSMFLLIPAMVAICIVQYYRQKQTNAKFQYILKIINPIIEKEIETYRENLIPKIQKLINSISDLLNENNISSEKYKTWFFNNSYENIEILGENSIRGMRYFIIKIL
ncbi:MAG: hypothetical protein ACTSVY_06155 [Candidatus Helarchaeota archaeon]